jgi:hypothetical protein
MVHHSVFLCAAGRRGSGSLMRRPGGIKFLFVEHFARARFAGAATRGDARARLQLLERTRAFVNGLLQAALGDSVAETNVHFVATS